MTDPLLIGLDEREARSHIVVGAITPRTVAGRSAHRDWHDRAITSFAPKECGSAGCGFLGRILGIEAEILEPAVREYLEGGHHPACCGICDECFRICAGYHGQERRSKERRSRDRSKTIYEKYVEDPK